MSEKNRGKELLESVRNWAIDRVSEVLFDNDGCDIESEDRGRIGAYLHVERHIRSLIKKENESCFGWVDRISVSVPEREPNDDDDLEITVDGSELMNWGEEEYAYVSFDVQEGDRNRLDIIGLVNNKILRFKDKEYAEEGSFEVICYMNDINDISAGLRKALGHDAGVINFFDVSNIVEEEGSVWKDMVWERIDEKGAIEK